MTDAKNDHAAVRVFPPGVLLATVVAGAGLQWLWPIDLGFELPSPARHWIGGIIIAGALLGLGVWAVLLFWRSGQSVKPWDPTPEVLQEGPYRFTRNPMYLMLVLICIGFAILLWNPWILILTPICAWVLRKYAIEQEERYLEAKFGEAYLAYKRRVRRWL